MLLVVSLQLKNEAKSGIELKERTILDDLIVFFASYLFSF